MFRYKTGILNQTSPQTFTEKRHFSTVRTKYLNSMTKSCIQGLRISNKDLVLQPNFKMKDVSTGMYWGSGIRLKRQLKTRGHSLRIVDLRVQNQAPGCYDYDARQLITLPILFAGQAVSRQLPNAVVQFRFHVRPCGFYGTQNGIEVGFLWILRFPMPILSAHTAPH
jgi:hypothetical protein